MSKSKLSLMTDEINLLVQTTSYNLLVHYTSRKINRTTRRLPSVITYSDLMPDVHQIVRKHMDVLYPLSRMSDIFQESLTVAFRRDKNLCDMLVHGKTDEIN